MDSSIVTRFKGAEWFIGPENIPPITIGGCGGIGSWSSFFITRAGFNVVCYDDDVVEEHNLGGQLYSEASIGEHKVKAMEKIINLYSRSGSFMGFPERIEENSISSSITPFCFSAFDNMKARKVLFEEWKKIAKEYYEFVRSNISTYTTLLSKLKAENKEFSEEYFDTEILLQKIYNSPVPFFLDGRLEMEQMQIFFVTIHDIDKYEKTLFDDSLVEDLPCSLKQTSHTAAMIASNMMAIFTNHVVNCKYGALKEIRDTPFYMEFFIPLMLQTKNEKGYGS